MQSKATTVQEYLNELPEDRKPVLKKLRKLIKDNLPKGFKEQISYGMIGYIVPHSVYPAGYHCDPKLPLPFLNLASQKNYIALYHLGIYADKKLMKWFESEYSKRCKAKLDMGKSCIRFKKMEDIPYELIAELLSKMTPKDWIALYERNVKQG